MRSVPEGQHGKIFQLVFHSSAPPVSRNVFCRSDFRASNRIVISGIMKSQRIKNGSRGNNICNGYSSLKRRLIGVEQLDAKLPVRDIYARKILDCRGNPTVEAEVLGGREYCRKSLGTVRPYMRG